MSKRSVVHIEIPAQNRESLAGFYQKVFGWDFEHMSEPSPYSMSESGNKIGVGLPDIGSEYQPGNVIIYLDSDDVAADLRKIEEAGGRRLSEPFKVGEMGEMAFFSDPTGNRLALWKTLMPNG